MKDSSAETQVFLSSLLWINRPIARTRSYAMSSYAPSPLPRAFPASVRWLCDQPIARTANPPQATSVKDGIEDFSRHQADAQENSRMVTRLVVPGQRRRRSSTGIAGEGGGGRGGGGGAGQEASKAKGSLIAGGGTRRPPGVTEKVSWMDVRVGDVLEIRNRENIPADLVMLSCSDSKGTCFVMTSNLDGETNLKPRRVSPDLRAAVEAADDAAAAAAGLQGGTAGVDGGQRGVLALAAKGAFVECDLPNQRLEHFDGTLAVSAPYARNWAQRSYPLLDELPNDGELLYAPPRTAPFPLRQRLRHAGSLSHLTRRPSNRSQRSVVTVWLESFRGATEWLSTARTSSCAGAS